MGKPNGSPVIHYDASFKVHAPEELAFMEAAAKDCDIVAGYTPESFVAAHHVVPTAYAEIGQQAFVVGPRLQKMLGDTDCRQVPAQFFKLPFPCFYVALPECAWAIFGDERTGMHQVAGVYVIELVPGTIGLYMWGAPNSRSVGVHDDAVRWTRLTVEPFPVPDGEPFSINEIPRIRIEGSTFLEFESFLADQGRVSVSERGEVKAEIGDDWLKVCRVVINMVLYLNSTKVETTIDDSAQQLLKDIETQIASKKSGAKKAKLARRASRLSGARITWVAKSYEAREDQSPSGASTRRWTVIRGHFGHYWVGSRTASDGTPRLGERRVLKWIEPVYNLGVDPPVAAHQYRFHGDLGAPQGA